MLTGIDSEYATGSRTNLKGETHYEHYSYTLATKKTIEGFNIFPTIMKFAAQILSSNGYLNQNIKSYEATCLAPTKDASGIYEIEGKEGLNFILQQREKQIRTLNASMDAIVAKEFNHFKAPELKNAIKD